MKYKFTVEFIDNTFLEANPKMHPNHPDYRKAVHTTVYELQHGEDIPMSTAQENLALSMEANGSHVISISGVAVE